MLLEYLADSEYKADDCLSLVDRTNTTAYKRPLNEIYYIVSIETKVNDETAAKLLSDINERIISNLSVTVLSNGSAEYFNKALYPLANDFERKLRKLLYAASALKPDKGKVIAGLETMDFGTLFEMLFLDQEYYKNVKTYVNGKSEVPWTGFSSDLLAFINNEKENLLWDRLLYGQVPLLRSSFNEIRNRRNDIMHAHNINKSEFNKARNLFKSVNEELDKAINGLADGALIPDTYNQEIKDAFLLVTDKGEVLTDNGIPLVAIST